MTDTKDPADENQPGEGKPLREIVPDEVDHRALRRWIQDFLYVSPPATDREYKGITLADEER